jgi:tRNA (cytidine56-2'-O)-methyltransferase
MLAILRIGHRKLRDARLSTHCGLIARALGADEIIYSGEEDAQLIESLKKASERWGGNFRASYDKNWRNVIRKFSENNFKIIHLTMFGIPFQKKIKDVRKSKNTLVIIGSEKVPGEVYGMSDFNLAVTSQPHSEAAALALFIHEYFQGKELDIKFQKAKIKIIPQEMGKKTQKNL